MAVETTTEKIAIGFLLNNGQTESGGIRTVKVNLGTLNKNTYTDQLAMNMATLLNPCFDKSLVKIQKQITQSLANGD